MSIYRLITPRAVCAAITVMCALTVPAQAQTIEYYHVDALGSVRAVTNQSGAVIERHDYLPFGEEVSPAAGAQSHQFTGKERDAETGMDYFGARYFSAKRARFTTVDPVFTWQENLEDPQRWNRYAYVRNNPLRYTDPDGRVIFDFKEFKANLTEALRFGQDGYGYVVPTVAGIAAIGSVAGDALIFSGGVVNVLKAAGREGLKRVGSKIDRTTFKKEREAFWKTEESKNSSKYREADLARVKTGRPPVGSDGHPMELHHVDRTPEGGVTPMTRTEHRLGENFKKNHPK